MSTIAWASILPMMSIQDNLQHSPDPSAAVFRPGEFLGREGLVRNVLRRLECGESLSIVGGPKLGKTSLLLYLAWQLNHASPHPRSNGPAAVYCDLADQADCDRFRSASPDNQVIVLLDNCDRVVEGNNISLSEHNLARRGATVFAGARAWQEFVRGEGLARKVKTIPLAVFLEKEARDMFCQSLSPEQKACLLTYAGSHPFLLKVLQAEFLRGTPHVPPDQVVEGVKRNLGPFFQCCIEQVRESEEHGVLTYLIKVSKPVNPREVARAVGLPTVKPIADTLCYLGLISRWIRDEEATLSAHSRLFNEWYMETVTSSRNRGLY